MKKNGITVIISCQDDHKTLRDCVESFLLFGDELIIVTNRATIETSNLAKKLSIEYNSKVTYIDAPHAKDLYQNRQVGLNHANYCWVMRCDADYIAYENCDGKNSIQYLRDYILRLKPIWPTAIFISKVSLSLGWDKMYEIEKDDIAQLKYIPSVYTGKKEARIYSQNPFLCFRRLGRWEGVPWIKWYRKIRINKPYWFEVTIRDSEALLFRKARTDWRQLGDFKNYPELADYIKNIFLPNEYPGLSIKSAAKKYIEDEVFPKIKPYDEKKYFPLPSRIKSKQSSKCE
ncbi:glycosyltransferase family 2 protein [uncultured Desulfosarcina sp.]|uniref:glycosyltransferase family 2 protein n=1 Tax=uncultured Desulfosarcina sp. TaxID=218289 RepID=UPI0029C81A49|nr:glycosyltransferase family 2 protein [uncultured Desulfosarcina sp.]